MKILCPVDFSESSLVAIEYAVKIAQKHQAEITLAFIFTEMEFNKRLLDANIRDIDTYKLESETKLRRMVETIKNRKHLGRVDYLVETGNFLQSIKDLVNTLSIDLVVIGSKGASNVLEKMAGTNTVNLIEGLEVPILMVPKNSDYTKITDIVYASDYSKYDIDSLSQIMKILAPFDPTVTFLHLTNTDNIDLQEKYEEFNHKIQLHFEKKINFKIRKYDSSIALAIDDFMLEKKANVLGIYMERHNLIERIFHKSVTLQLTYLMDFPLLIIKKSKVVN